MHASARAASLTTALILIACGGADAPDAGPPSGDATPSQASEAQSGSPNTMINEFEFSPTGATPAADLPTLAELSLVGGCRSTEPLSIGFTRGAGTDDTYFHFAFESADPVAPGQTGEVALSEVVWDNGVEVPANLPANTTIRVPSRLQGTGTLTLNTHTGSGAAGRMAGVVEGSLTDDTGEVASIEARFDIHLACVR